MAEELKIVKSGLPWSAIFKMGKDPVGFLLKHQEETGDLYRVDAPIKFVLVSNPDHVRHVLLSNWRNYEKGPAYEGFRLFLGNGLLTSEGEHWKRHRKIIQPSFSKEHIREMAVTIDKTAQKWVEQWSNAEKGVVEAKSSMLEFTLEVISNAIIGEELTERYKNEFMPLFQAEYDFVLERNLSIFKLPMGFPIPSHIRFKKTRKIVDEIVYKLIQEKRNVPDTSMLSAFIETKDDNGQGLTDEELRDEYLTLFATGFESTGTSVAWTILLLAKHPEIQEKVFNEIKDLDQNNYQAFFKSPWLNAICNETIRLYPAAWILSRRCIKEDVIDDRTIPKKSTMFISIFNMHRDKKYWDDPHEFKPERFIDAEPNPSFHPYGIGPRKCIGNYFSQVIQLYIMYHLILNFKIELAVDRGYEVEPKISLKPAGNLNIKVIKRD